MHKYQLIKILIPLAILLSNVTVQAQTNASYLRIAAMPVSAVSPLDYLVYGKQSGTNYFWYHRYMQDFFSDFTNSAAGQTIWQTISNNTVTITGNAATAAVNLNATSNTLAGTVTANAATAAANLNATSNTLAGTVTANAATAAANLYAASNTLAANSAANLASASNSLTASILAAVPAFSLAAIQFSDFPVPVTISNDAQTAYGLLHVAPNSFPPNLPSPYAVSVITNASQIQIAAFQTNTPFFVVPTATNNAWVRVYSNYVSAVSGSGWLPVLNTGAGTANQFLYLTNFTSYNADVIQIVTGPATIRPGICDVYFRTNVQPVYYVSGAAIPESADGYPQLVSIAQDWMINTNFARLSIRREDNYQGATANYCSPLVHVLVSPY